MPLGCRVQRAEKCECQECDARCCIGSRLTELFWKFTSGHLTFIEIIKFSSIDWFTQMDGYIEMKWYAIVPNEGIQGDISIKACPNIPKYFTFVLFNGVMLDRVDGSSSTLACHMIYRPLFLSIHAWTRIPWTKEKNTEKVLMIRPMFRASCALSPRSVWSTHAAQVIIWFSNFDFFHANCELMKAKLFPLNAKM